jgi:hypothetical protein
VKYERRASTLKAFYQELRHAFNLRWIIGVIIIAIAMFISFWPECLDVFGENVTATDAFFSMYSKGSLYQIAILCACLPYTLSWQDDRKSGVAKYALGRTKRVSFFSKRFFAAFFSSASCVITGEALILCLCLYLYPYPDIDFTYIVMPPPFSGLYDKSPLLYFAFYMLISGITSAAWASIGLAISAFVHHALIVLAIPVLAYSALFYSTRPLYIGFGFFPARGEAMDLVINTAIVIGILMISGLIFWKGVRRYDGGTI